MSTAAPSGLPDPFSSAQAGWIATSQTIDPYTGLAAGDDDGNAFTGGQTIDPFTGATPDGDNPNAFTGGQNVDPFSGGQDTESFTGTGASQQSPPPTGSGWGAFGLSGPPPSILSDPNLTAENDAVPTNTNIATDAANPTSITLGGEQWAWTSNTVQLGNTVYNQFSSADGTEFALQPVGGGPIVIVSADGTVEGAYSESGAFVPAPIQRSPGTPPPADFVPDPQETTRTTPTTTQSAPAPGAAAADPQLTPAQEAQLNAAIQQAVGPDPTAGNPGPPQSINDVLSGTDGASPPATPNQPPTSPPPGPSGSGTVPFNPMADSPFASWLLYGNDTPILDFLTNDSHLKVAQNVALGVAVGAGTIATGGLLLDAAPAIGNFAFEASIQVAARFPTATSIATGLGNAMTWTTVPRVAVGVGGAAIAAGAADELPALEQGIGNAVGNAVNEFGEATGPSFEGVINPSEFENDPNVIDRLSRAREFDVGGYQSLTGRGQFGRVGDNLDSDEALQNAFIRMAKDVARVSPVTRDNPAMALTPQLHRLIQNLTTSQMQGMNANQVLQFHLQQMQGFVPDYILTILERESLQYIARTFPGG